MRRSVDANEAMDALREHGISLSVSMGYWQAHARNEQDDLVCSKQYFGKPLDAIVECVKLLTARTEVTTK